MSETAVLLLDGEEPFFGSAVGAPGLARGTMAAAAYSAGIGDLLTDPSYGGRIVCFTYPHIGTSGIVPGDLQSDAPLVRGVAAREIGRMSANRLGTETMAEYLERNAIPTIEALDTRSVTEAVARRGLARAVLGTGSYADVDLLRQELAKKDDPAWLVPEAGVTEAADWREGESGTGSRLVLVYDFGVKRGFLRRLAEKDCRIRLVPKTYPAAGALAEKPAGIVFSAGTGTPETRAASVAVAGDLLGKVPLWGIGVGAGVVAAAAGAKITVDGRGHYGAQPAGHPDNPIAEMTNQCHDFWIDADSLSGASLGLTHFNLNDKSVEGFKCGGRRIIGSLFHPEGEPGPRDSVYLFDRFVENMTQGV